MERREKAHSDLSGKVDWGASVSHEAERMLLGLFLVRGNAFDLAAGEVQVRHFYEPLHRRIFEIISGNRSKGLTISRSRMEDLLSIDSAYRASGAGRYMDQIISAASMAEIEGQDVAAICRLVRDLFVRREVIQAAADIHLKARQDGIITGEELRSELEKRLFQADFRGVGVQLEKFSAIAARALDRSTKGGVDLISTGFRKLDDRLSRLERSDLVVLAARPSMGKSAMAATMGRRGAKAGLGVISFSGETTADQQARRMLSDEAHELYGARAPAYRDIRSGDLTDEQRHMIGKADEALKDIPFVHMKRPGLSVPEMRAIARRQQIEWRDQGIILTFVISDHIGIFSSGQKTNGRYEEVTAVSNGLKALGSDLDCVSIALSQLSRAVEQREDKRPMISDLRESGAIEQDADVVIGLYREAYYAEREKMPDKYGPERQEWLRRKGSKSLDALVLKVKEGAPGKVEMWADVARNAIRDDAPDEGTPTDTFNFAKPHEDEDLL